MLVKIHNTGTYECILTLHKRPLFNRLNLVFKVLPILSRRGLALGEETFFFFFYVGLPTFESYLSDFGSEVTFFFEAFEQHDGKHGLGKIQFITLRL